MTLIKKDLLDNNITQQFDNDIIIATSLAPGNKEFQRAAIRSWLSLGFKVVSLNVSDEVDILRPQFPEIEFVNVARSAVEKYGKPFIFFDDFLEFFRNHSVKICGIVNSDIIFPDPDLKNIIKIEAPGSFIYGSRIEVEDITNPSGAMLESGFDFFFFDREIISCYPKEEFCLGQQMWDWWAVLNPAVRGIPVKKIMGEFAYHVTHPQKWERESPLRLILQKYFPPIHQTDSMSDYLLFMFNLINHHTQFIFPDDVNNTEQPQILIVYDNQGSDLYNSVTYQSILNQTYSNIRIQVGKFTEFDFSQIKEEFVYFIEEGYLLNPSFVTTMVAKIGSADYAVCGLSRFYNRDLSFYQSLYMIHDLNGRFEYNYLAKNHYHVCTLFRTKSFIASEINERLLESRQMRFVGMGLVETSLDNYLKNELAEIREQRIFIYGAGGHTRLILENIETGYYNFCGILDKDDALDGRDFCGYRIFNRNRIKELSIDFILISSETYEKEIYDELKETVDERKLIRLYYDSVFYKA